jgi:hypothetical protein
MSLGVIATVTVTQVMSLGVIATVTVTPLRKSLPSLNKSPPDGCVLAGVIRHEIKNSVLRMAA